MLPSRSTLRGWNPESLTAAADELTSAMKSVSNAVHDIDDGCRRMPETRAWTGRSHDAAAAMFGRAERRASTLADYADAVAAALRQGSDSIGATRKTLLDKADELDAGPLDVSDQWVVLIDPVRMSADELARLEALARSAQEDVNRMLCAVGDADDDTANGLAAAASRYGYQPPGPPGGLGSLMVPTPQRPADQVPNPRDPVGAVAQEAIRRGDMSVAVRDVSGPVEDEYGDEVTTVTMQDGSKQVTTTYDPFDWPDRQNFASITQYDRDGNEVSRTSSWHDLGNQYDYTTVAWSDGSTFTMTMDPTGTRNAGFSTADGRHSAVPVDLIDDISLHSGAALSGLEKHVVHGGSLPMVTASSIENVGKAAKFGGPALGIATTVFDMAMANSRHDACVALVAGAAGAGGGWGGAELGAALGAIPVPVAWATVPAGALAGGIVGAILGENVGQFIGDVVCPY